MGAVDEKSSPMLKLGRAKEHFHQFVAELDEFYRSEPWTFSTSFEGNDLVLRLDAHAPIPDRLALLVGDLIHNARSALDCAIAEIADRGLGSFGRPPETEEEERSLSFPVTPQESGFTKALKKLRPFLPEKTLRIIEILQPWREAEIFAEHNGSQDDPNILAGWRALSYVRRLHTLSNIDKHRRLTMSLYRPDSVTESTTGDFGDDLAEYEERFEGIEWLGVPVRERTPHFPPGTFPEGFVLPDPNDVEYDFFFEDGVVEDGCEIGRYISSDRSRKMDDINIRARLRIVLYEPGLTDEYDGAPLIETVLAEIIDEVSKILEMLDPDRDWGADESPTAETR